MIQELTIDNYNLFTNSFLKEEEVYHELDNNPFAKYLIYIIDDRVVGFLYYSDIYERCEINQIEVEIIHRNCGIGSKLMEEFLKSVDKDITLEVRIDNFPAIALYKKYGFVEKTIRKGYYQGVDGILMERSV